MVRAYADLNIEYVKMNLCDVSQVYVSNIMKCKYCGKNFNAKNAIFCSKKCDSYYSAETTRKSDVKYTQLSINVNQDVYTSLRLIQSDLIKNTNENISLSQVVNSILSEGIKIKKMTLKNV
jgi:hypothetical protein